MITVWQCVCVCVCVFISPTKDKSLQLGKGWDQKGTAVIVSETSVMVIVSETSVMVVLVNKDMTCLFLDPS